MSNVLPPAADAPGKPTRVRFWVVGLATLMSFLLYLDRYFMSFLMPFLNQEFNLSEFETGLLLSIFFWSYAAAQVPAGAAQRPFRARLMLTLYIVGWSIFTGLMGVAGTFVGLLLLRLGIGLTRSEGPPTAQHD